MMLAIYKGHVFRIRPDETMELHHLQPPDAPKENLPPSLMVARILGDAGALPIPYGASEEEFILDPTDSQLEYIGWPGVLPNRGRVGEQTDVYATVFGEFERVETDYYVPGYRERQIEPLYVANVDSDHSKGFRQLTIGGHKAGEFGYPIYRRVAKPDPVAELKRAHLDQCVDVDWDRIG